MVRRRWFDWADPLNYGRVIGWFLFGSLLAFLLIGLGIGQWQRGLVLPALALYLFGAFGVFIILMAIRELIGSTTIRVTPSKLKTQRGPLPPLRKKRLNPEEIRELLVQKTQHRVEVQTWRTYQILAITNAWSPPVEIDDNIRNPQEAEYLRGVLCAITGIPKGPGL